MMGMPIRVDVRGPDLALDAVFGWLRFVDATFSTFRPESEISRIGRGALARADAHELVREVLDRCDELHRLTSGAFDIRPRSPGASTRRAWSRAGRSSAPPGCSRRPVRGAS
jgi:thiamine biosynthesis lipoprotein